MCIDPLFYFFFDAQSLSYVRICFYWNETYFLFCEAQASCDDTAAIVRSVQIGKPQRHCYFCVTARDADWMEFDAQLVLLPVF